MMGGWTGGCCGLGLFGGFGGLGVVGWILNLVITVGLIVGAVILVIWLVRRLSSGASLQGALTAGGARPSAKEILQERYARGEITREQYQEMLSDLK